MILGYQEIFKIPDRMGGDHPSCCDDKVSGRERTEYFLSGLQHYK